MSSPLINYIQNHNVYGLDTLYPFNHDAHFEEPPPLERSVRDRFQSFLMRDLQLANDQLREAITLLQKKEEDVSRSIAYHRAVISPVRWLPEELLAKIFLLSLPASDPRKSTQFLSPIDTALTPWRLSYVCRRWRSVVLNLPHIWPSGIEIHFRQSHKSDEPFTMPQTQGALQLTKLVLQRSHPLLLDIRLAHSIPGMIPGVDSDGELPSPLIHPFLRELFRHSSRYRSFNASFRDGSILYLPGLLPTHFPKLRYLGYGQGFSAQLRDAMKSAPELRELQTNTLFFFPTKTLLSEFAVSLRSITHLTLGAHSQIEPTYGSSLPGSPQATLTVLAAMPNLEHCRLAVTLGVNESDLVSSHIALPRVDVVMLPRLSYLYLESDGARSMITTPFISKLKLPALGQLHLAVADPPSSCLTQLIQNSSHHITSLIIDRFVYDGANAAGTVHDFISTLRSLHDLKYLDLGHWHPDSQLSLLGALVIDQTQDANGGPATPSACPHLQTLNFLILHAPRSSVAFSKSLRVLLTDIVRSRPRSTPWVSSLSLIEVKVNCVNIPRSNSDWEEYVEALGVYLDLKELVDNLRACNPVCGIRVHAEAGRPSRRGWNFGGPRMPVYTAYYDSESEGKGWKTEYIKSD